jgi:hypothetical protein
MSDFKIGDRVVITGHTKGYVGCLKVGDTAHIAEFYSPEGKNMSARMVCDGWADSCYHSLNNIELKPKWSIYNNTLPWSQLRDKQKGKLLVAENDGHEIKGLNCTTLNKPVRFDCHHITYFAVEAVPVKPEPTMAEVFVADWHEANVHLVKEFSEYMIAKGWVKK